MSGEQTAEWASDSLTCSTFVKFAEELKWTFDPSQGRPRVFTGLSEKVKAEFAALELPKDLNKLIELSRFPQLRDRC